MNSIEQENQRLRRELQTLREAAETNHEVLRNSRLREHRLLASQTLPALFDNFVSFLRTSFGVAEVTVVLQDPDHELRHLTAFTMPRGVRTPPGVRFCDRLNDEQSGLEALRRVTLGEYDERRHGALFAPGIGSVALLPLMRGVRPVGVIALGAGDPARFHRGLAIDYLQNLAVVAQIALENAVNRATLLNGALTDPLTGLRNRRYLDTRLSEELGRARRERKAIACLLLDIDYFKRVNDTYGHLAGDDVLRAVAERVQQEVRASDVCARYGGEEIAVLLPDTRRPDAVALAERMRQIVCGAPIAVSVGRAVTVTASLGVSTLLPAQDMPLAEARQRLLSSADAALYQAKSQGRDRVCNAA
jgi:two-component system cell cycle response regulator